MCAIFLKSVFSVKQKHTFLSRNMSNLIFMDESNGNGGYVTSTTTTSAAAGAVASVSRTINNTNIKNNNNNISNNINININNNNYNNNNCNNINNIMAAASNAATAAASAAASCVGGVQLPNSVSNEDLSQSLSEYTDADESISAPTEFLAEFLSAVMLKDYKKALKYCKLILQYEPDNSTAKEFYPLILDKLRGTNTSSDSDENYNKSSSSPELILEAPSSDPSAGESDEHDEQYLRHIRGGAYNSGNGGGDKGSAVINTENNDPNSNVSTSSSAEVEEEDEVEGDEEEGCGSMDGSLSEDDVEDDDEDDCEDDDEEDDDDDDDEDVDDEDDIMSSSGDDLPVDEQQILVGDVLDLDASSANACGVEAAINISNSSRNSSSGGKGSSRSDNTTHSYSSLLLEEEDDIVPANLHFPKDLHTTDLDVSNGNKVPSTSCSDSESPTEPLTQRLAAILRSKCGVSNTGG
ncbi:probable serine/threonine-protein kinase DDB_G0267686 [Lucilia cuprina]|uniref:probable serine/threonine-protein kinase DDB_G0267686 n=1 Tax=Lucilia cuprina TaxID=7375 RepID=UPI001F065BED|nr:probable serine/threonine-protein kinase DDB_G0267686 [Lucilia cuprina]XP_046804432.1 probable serine/threonine-protein kinase DDB_G0267686 [Lucilia cuprina]XP_046804434.1 probable serine/threonine-protein kinase DDB_G0267686 [Lucilia cuprina]XP_046804435.1 probable serine/threonine-protein kinase DDB_G0267686 [Lucilia cuprina]XP_046804436.1 probable serine/threonine-protein kinase DDB_G0267686 [Lucilia cuprina]XP_046804437.1 probable serine/threonine-protein kinase DDB_G0267686 [Lucilia cu